MKTLFIVDEWEGTVSPEDTIIPLDKWASKIVYMGCALDCDEAFKYAKESEDDRRE